MVHLKKNYKIAFIISSLLLLCTAATAYYEDFKSLTIWSVNVWDNLYTSGNPLNFYAYSAQNIYGAPHATVGSDFLIYIPWAIWNLPLWILQRFFGLIILEHPLMLFYSKCFLLALVFGCCVIIKKIAGLFSADAEHTYISIFLFMSGFFTLLSMAYIGQNDILVIFVMLLALYSLFRGKWYGFLFLAALSIAFKPYFIFPYVAIVLLKEKRIHFIALYGISGISIYLLQKIPFLNAPMYQESMANGPTKAILNLLIENVINITPHMVSLFVLCLLAVYVLAYFDNMDTNGNVKVIYYCLLSYMCFFLLTRYESYRPLYLFVFIDLMILAKPAYYRLNLLLETVSTACLMYYYLYNGGCFFDGQYLLLPFAKTGTVALTPFVKGIVATSYTTVCMAVLLLCMVIFAVINHPKFRVKSKVLTMKEEPYLVVLRSCLFAAPYLAAVLLRYL